MNWYRVEFSESGKVLSCRIVGDSTTGARRIVCVEAPDEQQAITLARALYNAHARQRMAETRARLREEGKCRCGRPRDAGGSYCSWCLERKRVHKERLIKRQRGEHVPPADWKATREERRDMELADLRASILVEVENAFEAMRPAEFRRWLAEQITTARRRAA